MTAGPSLHVAREPDSHVGRNPDGEVDIDAAQRAAADFLGALGIDVDSEDLRETPARMARAYAELFSPHPLRLTTFANDEGYDELVLARSIPFRTVCEHHLLPFIGRAHVAYLPRGKVIGLSKVARIVDMYARRLQIQESLTRQIADAMLQVTGALGVGVIVEARHLCMQMRGVEKQNSTMKTSVMLGAFRNSAQTRNEFLALLKD